MNTEARYSRHAKVVKPRHIFHELVVQQTRIARENEAGNTLSQLSLEAVSRNMNLPCIENTT